MGRSLFRSRPFLAGDSCHGDPMKNHTDLNPRCWTPAPGERTCDATAVEFLGRSFRMCSRDVHDPRRCGAPAALVLRSRCGCGACDMTVHLCEKHHAGGWWAPDAPVSTEDGGPDETHSKNQLEQ